MSDFVSERNVLLHQTAATREEALRIISDYSVELGAADDADAVYAGFLAREEIDQTGMMEGFAIPHCKTDAVKRAAAVVFKNETPLEWPSLDGKPVDIAVALLVPDAEAGTTHLRLLSKTAVLLMNEEFKRLVREGDDPKAIAGLINAELDKE
ncbi:PTS sugar transporter subunit IIA [Thermophilibacter sp.]